MALAPRPNQDKNSKEALNHRRTTGRGVLLVIVAFTVINLFLLLTKANRYLIFSAALPYYATLFSLIFDGGSIGGYTVAALVVSAVMVGLYIACWVLSGTQGRWITAGLILFAVDTVMLAVIAIVLNAFAAALLDLVVHGVGLWELWQAMQANKKLGDSPSAAALKNRPRK